MEILENGTKSAVKEPEALTGLSAREVEEQRSLGNVNVVNEKVGKSYGRIIADNLLTFFNMVWAIVAVILVLVNEIGNLTFLFRLVEEKRRHTLNL